MRYQWDDQKEQINIKKHGLDFTTASMVFDDPNMVEIFDEAHSGEEDRYKAIGRIGKVVTVITVVYTERGEKIRLISARVATKEEEEIYYDC